MQESSANLLVSKNIDENISILSQQLNIDGNFDLQQRFFYFTGRRAVIFFIDGFMNSDVLGHLMGELMVVERVPGIEGIAESGFIVSEEEEKTTMGVKVDFAQQFAEQFIPYFNVTLSEKLDELELGLFAGLTLLIVDGLEKGMLIDTRSYPQRVSSEPEKDKVFRGSRDGFLESMIRNVALIRRRIRSPKMEVARFAIGQSTKTDVALCFFNGRAEQKMVDELKQKLDGFSNDTNIDALTMNQESLSELLFPPKWYNVFPKVKYTERPDTAAAQLLKGSIVILVDNSPSAMILPVNFFEIMEEANDFYFPPLVGAYQKFCRIAVSLISIFWTPVWLMINRMAYGLSGAVFEMMRTGWLTLDDVTASQPIRLGMLPEWCRFLIVQEETAIPLILQLLLLEIIVDGLKLASLNTPSMLTTSLSMVGAIVVSDFAVESGWVAPEALLYTAFIAIATYSQPDFQMGYAFKFVRLALLFAVWAFGVWGLLVGAGYMVVRVVWDLFVEVGKE